MLFGLGAAEPEGLAEEEADSLAVGEPLDEGVVDGFVEGLALDDGLASWVGPSPGSVGVAVGVGVGCPDGVADGGSVGRLGDGFAVGLEDGVGEAEGLVSSPGVLSPTVNPADFPVRLP